SPTRVRPEAPRLHHAARRRGGCVATGSTGSTARYSGGGFSSSIIARNVWAHYRWVSARSNDAGFVDGQNVAIEYRWARGEYDRLAALAVELVQRRVRVILAGGGEVGASAAKAAPRDDPHPFKYEQCPGKIWSGCELNRAGRPYQGSDDRHFHPGSKEVRPAMRDDPERSPCCDAY